jgi:hypothetical protein
MGIDDPTLVSADQPLTSNNSYCGLACLLQDIAKRYPDGIPLLDPVTDMGIDDPTLVSAIQNMNDLEQQLAKNPGKFVPGLIWLQLQAVVVEVLANSQLRCQSLNGEGLTREMQGQVWVVFRQGHSTIYPSGPHYYAWRNPHIILLPAHVGTSAAVFHD